jgi:hypothetical protein
MVRSLLLYPLPTGLIHDPPDPCLSKGLRSTGLEKDRKKTWHSETSCPKTFCPSQDLRIHLAISDPSLSKELHLTGLERDKKICIALRNFMP